MRFVEDLFVRDGPRHARDRGGQDEQPEELQPFAHAGIVGVMKDELCKR